MFQSTLGVVILFLGVALAIFSERAAKSQIRFNRWAFGLEPVVSEELTRGSVILVGVSFAIFGLAILLHVIPAD